MSKNHDIHILPYSLIVSQEKLKLALLETPQTLEAVKL
jgi:hypothetical protein